MTESLAPSYSPSGFGYSAAGDSFDEAFDTNGAARPHQTELWNGLATLGRTEIGKRWELGRRLVRENGVTYNVYGDPRGMDRPWVLDLVLTDETNPRSVAFQLARLDEHLRLLPNAEREVGLSPVARIALRVLQTVRLAELSALARPSENRKREKLDELLATLEEGLPALAEQLTLSYLAHAEPSVSLGHLEEG
jgi:hypothetical protein